MKNIGILGCGWLGFSLAEELIKENYNVKGTTTTLSKFTILKDNAISPYYIDLQENKIDFLDDFLENIDCLIICIPPKYQLENFSYKDNFILLIPFLEKHSITKVIFMSSVSVYAPSPNLITEKSRLINQDIKSKQIFDAENLFLNHPSINVSILRLGGLFGLDRKPVKYICAKDELQNPDLPINMVHQYDIIAYTKSIIKKDFESNSIFNLVSNKYHSRLDYYTKQALKENLTLPALGTNNTQLYKKISGDKIVQFTNIEYQY